MDGETLRSCAERVGSLVSTIHETFPEDEVTNHLEHLLTACKHSAFASTKLVALHSFLTQAQEADTIPNYLERIYAASALVERTTIIAPRGATVIANVAETAGRKRAVNCEWCKVNRESIVNKYGCRHKTKDCKFNDKNTCFDPAAYDLMLKRQRDYEGMANNGRKKAKA